MQTPKIYVHEVFNSSHYINYMSVKQDVTEMACKTNKVNDRCFEIIQMLFNISK